MTNIYKYDIVVVKFPFASSLKYKARPAVATIQRDSIITKLGKLQDNDIKNLNNILDMICLIWRCLA